MPPDKILKVRHQESKPIMDAFREWLNEQSMRVRPNSQTGKAVKYALGQWEKLKVFLTNPYVPIDNNQVEAAIRPFVIGRKNWVFANSVAGAETSAGLYTLIESARSNNIEPFSYLRVIFKELPKCSNLEDYQRLLPYNITKHFEVEPILDRKAKLPQ